jgi:hypothetical protein
MTITIGSTKTRQDKANTGQIEPKRRHKTKTIYLDQDQARPRREQDKTTTRQDKTRQDETRQDKTRQDKTR